MQRAIVALFPGLNIPSPVNITMECSAAAYASHPADVQYLKASDDKLYAKADASPGSPPMVFHRNWS